MKLFIIPILLLISLNALAQSTPFHSKLAPPLRAQQIQLATRSAATHKWTVSVTDTTKFRHFLMAETVDCKIVDQYPPASILIIEVDPNVVFEKILPSEFVLFIDRAERHPREELAVSNLDLSANKVNLVHGMFPSLNGLGLTVSVKENDFDKNDIDFSGRIKNSAFGSDFFATHASIMATIIAGAGNSFYTGKGAAWGAELTTADFINLLPEPDDYYKSLKVTVQNHSYGVGIENYYGSDAAAYDASVRQRPELLHVFSSGNRGNLADTLGIYKGMTGYANLTGSFKMAKNILTVGSMDSIGTVPLLSSKGPAYDGRLKPELVAYGLDGSSGAAAMVSGIALLLQQAYRDTHGGTMPPAALVKAILLNSADDVEAPGIDFRSGYGRANAWRAVQAMLNGQFGASQLAQNETQAFSIHIPANARNLKVTLAWSDAPGTPNAAKALVNDLDLELVHTTTNESWLPWVLNDFPQTDSLVQLPIRKADHLNNAEQITVDNPPAGSYEIRVKGFDLSTTTQDFAIAYQMDTLDRFQWAFPAKGDHILAGETALLRWESTLTNSTGKLEYSLDNGANWQLIAENLDLNAGFYRWPSPELSATVQFRMSANNQTFTSGKITISQPLKIEVGFNCPDSLLLFWNPEPSAQLYTLYSLESVYLAPIITTSDTFVVLNKAVYPSNYFTIAPVVAGMQEGFKSATINYNNQATGCYLRAFLADRVDDTALLQLSLGTSYQVQLIAFERLTPTGFVEIVNLPAENQIAFQYADANLEAGINTYRARIDLKNGTSIYTEPADVYYQGDAGFFIFPNPVSLSESLNVLSRGGNELRFILFDGLGREVLDYQLIAGFETPPLQKLAAGVYHFVIFDANTKIGQGKLILTP